MPRALKLQKEVSTRAGELKTLGLNEVRWIRLLEAETMVAKVPTRILRKTRVIAEMRDTMVTYSDGTTEFFDATQQKVMSGLIDLGPINMGQLRQLLTNKGLEHATR